MRILITGGCGFLGSHLVEHFLKTTSHEIVVLDKLTYASNGYDRLRDIEGVVSNSMTGSLSTFGMPGRLQVIGCDLSQPLPAGVLQEIGDIDYVIHAAAESHVDNSITDPLPFLMSNVIGTHHLLMSWLVAGARRIFMVSTDEVYGPAPWQYPGFDEAAAFRPANPYAASKAGAECVAFAYANTYRLPITIVNTMNLIGERQHPEKFVPLVIRRVLAGEKVLIHADPTKTRSGTRFYLHCRTFANALAWMIRSHDEYWEMSGGKQRPDLPNKIHVCGEREMSNLELAQIIAGFVGKPLYHELVDFHSSRPGHDLRYAMDDSLICQLGWRRPMGIMDSLKKTVEWYLSNQRWLATAVSPRVKATPEAHRIPPEPVREPEPEQFHARGDANGELLLTHDLVRGARASRPQRGPRPAWADEIVDEGSLADDIGPLPAFIPPLSGSESENSKFESFIKASGLPNGFIDPEDDAPEAHMDYRVGIFADPLGADVERENERRDVNHRLMAVNQSMVIANERIVALEAAQAASRLVVGAVVEVMDGPAEGCRGRIKEALRQGVLFTVVVTWAPDRETAKYVDLAMTFTADQLRPQP